MRVTLQASAADTLIRTNPFDFCISVVFKWGAGVGGKRDGSVFPTVDVR